MKRTLEAILYFIISFAIGVQFIGLPASRIPFYGEAFVPDSLGNAFSYFVMYITASILFSAKFSKQKRMTYCVALLSFYIATALIGFFINLYLFWPHRDLLR